MLYEQIKKTMLHIFATMEGVLSPTMVVAFFAGVIF